MADGPGFVIWLTGKPAAGKSTLARSLRRWLLARGISSVIIDSDDLRTVLTPSPSYSDDERNWFYAVVAYLARWLSDAGVNVLIAATGNRCIYRDALREQVAKYAEVYVVSDETTRRARDPKGLYAQADAGRIANVPGIDAPYEPPLAPEATVNSAELSPDDAAAVVMAQLQEHGIVPLNVS